MKRLVYLAIVTLMALAGCHSHEVRGDRKVTDQKSDKPNEDKSGNGDKSAGKSKPTRQIHSERPVRTTAAGFFDAATVKKIQAALAQHGQKVEVTGELDGATQGAIQRFQKANAQPETGYPDYDTIGRLGLDPKQIYLGPAASKK